MTYLHSSYFIFFLTDLHSYIQDADKHKRNSTRPVGEKVTAAKGGQQNKKSTNLKLREDDFDLRTHQDGLVAGLAARYSDGVESDFDQPVDDGVEFEVSSPTQKKSLLTKRKFTKQIEVDSEKQTGATVHCNFPFA